mmetsp:Transcript_15490/g.46382  ORF Transcript_15490/g.46382 Transcript_15490/m.46382 type:complete len:333 (-) Transcript_15490:759-1757(-)
MRDRDRCACVDNTDSGREDTSGDRTVVRSDRASTNATLRHPATMSHQPIGGVCNHVHGLGAPESFGHGAGARPHTTVKVHRVHLFTPHRRLSAEQFAEVGRAAQTVGGLIVVKVNVGIFPFVVRSGRVRDLLIQVPAIGEDSLMTGAEHRVKRGSILPHLNDRRGGKLDAILEELLPAEEFHVARRHSGQDLVQEVLLHLADGCEALGSHPRAHRRVFRPTGEHHLITTQVNELVSKELEHIGQKVVHHLEGVLLTRIQRKVVDVAGQVRRTHRNHTRVTKAPAVRVTGHIELGHHTNSALKSILDNRLHVARLVLGSSGVCTFVTKFGTGL